VITAIRAGYLSAAFLHIAPRTAHITTAQTNEVRRLTRESTFTLDGIERLHDPKTGAIGGIQ
jgi:hypothetical protein